MSQGRNLINFKEDHLETDPFSFLANPEIEKKHKKSNLTQNLDHSSSKFTPDLQLQTNIWERFLILTNLIRNST